MYRNALFKATMTGLAINTSMWLLTSVVFHINDMTPQQVAARGLSTIALIAGVIILFGSLGYGALYGYFASQNEARISKVEYIEGGRSVGGLAQGFSALINTLVLLISGRLPALPDVATALIVLLTPFAVQGLIGVVLGGIGGRVYAAMRQQERIA